MEILARLELTPITLLVTFILPFAVFVIRRRYWYRPDLVKSYLAILQLIAGIGALAVLGHLAALPAGTGLPTKILAFNHILPAILTFFIVLEGRGGGAVSRGASPAGRDRDRPEGKQPAPIKKEDITQLTWDDLVVSDELKAELQSVVRLLKSGTEAKKYGINIPRGILLQGPPGTGKTSLARVVASTAGLSFFVLRMDEVQSQWVGESEKNLTKLFEAAKRAAPAIIFVDEVDSIGKRRGSGTAHYADNLLNHLLQLIDGVFKSEGIYIIAATNRAELVDAALKRPGRLEKVIEVPLPDASARKEIFIRALAKLKLADNVDLDELVDRTDGGSGAMIASICNQAGLHAFQRESHLKSGKRSYLVTQEDLTYALNQYAAGESQPGGKAEALRG